MSAGHHFRVDVGGLDTSSWVRDVSLSVHCHFSNTSDILRLARVTEPGGLQ